MQVAMELAPVELVVLTLPGSHADPSVVTVLADVFRRGRPGLTGTMARTAVVAGTASAVVGRSRERAIQSEEAAAYRAQQRDPVEPAPAPSAAPTVGDVVAQLTELSRLRETGVLTEQEFEATNARILASV